MVNTDENKSISKDRKQDNDSAKAILEEEMEVYGYKNYLPQVVVTWMLIILTLGGLRLVFHWWPHLMLFATHKKCSLSIADKVLIVERYQGRNISRYVRNVITIGVHGKQNIRRESIFFNTSSKQNDQSLKDINHCKSGLLSLHISGGTFKSCDTLRLFTCKKQCYIWDEEMFQFVKLSGLDKDVKTATLHQQKGLSSEDQTLRRVVYGNNEIVVPVQGIITLLFLEILNPFYVFQLFSFCLWFADDYMYYAIAILLMSAFGIIMAIIQTRKNQFNLRSTLHSSDVVTVKRRASNESDVISTENLVPGDVLIVPSHGCIMHCDAVLLNGTCIVNESMLTGESVPVTKTALPDCSDTLYDEKEHSRHTLFCGTQVIQTRSLGGESVFAVVIRTGFLTTKGNLVRSIMYPPPVDFQFEQDSYKFIELLAGIASIGFIYTVVTKFIRGMSISEIALESLDLITIVVPPALPAAMTVGRFYAQRRLEKRGVYCISPRTINVSGSVDCVCFDKTGTLTEDGLDMWGVLPVINKKFQLPVKYVDKMEYNELVFGMATCHSLTLIDEKLSGDPLDLKMFESTKWLLEEPNVNDNCKFDNMFPTVVRPPESLPLTDTNCEEVSCTQVPLEIGILRQFPFSSSLQRMSVITRKLGASHFQVYCKGSPEVITSLSQPNSVPSDFNTVLQDCTREGYRVLALSYKDLGIFNYARIHKLSRQDVESNLIFIGLLVMENKLKAGTASILSLLTDANIRTVMITGDNMLTALSVARDCGIVLFNQNVIIVNATPPNGSVLPNLHYTNSPNNNFNSSYMISTPSKVNGNTVTDSMIISSSNHRVNYSPNSSVSFDIMESSICGTTPKYCFALTGKTWNIIKEFFPDILPKVVTRGTVFARMSPEQKQQLVQELQHIDYYVAMCGDGANDCGALKAAHAGISLSDAESSVASPFTSKVNNISCVPDVIREGRAALVTSFGIFKYMAAYSLTQFVSVMILYSIDSNLTDIEYLYIDLFVITVFAFFFGRSEAFDGPLADSPPIMSLIALSPVLSLVLQIVVVVILQCTSFYTIKSAPFFEPFNATGRLEDEGSVACYENYALFTVSSMQYIILALIFSKGPPYRKPIYTNYGFSISLIFLTSFTIYLTIYPDDTIIGWFELQLADDIIFRVIMIAISIVNFLSAAFIEYFIVDYLFSKKLRYKFNRNSKSQKKFRAIDEVIQMDPSWPPITDEPVNNYLVEIADHASCSSNLTS